MASLSDHAKFPYDWAQLATIPADRLHAYVALRAKFHQLEKELYALPLCERVELMIEALAKAKAKKQQAA